MRNQKQIDASRTNGRRSHGALTPEGKARIVDANLRSGIFAQTRVLAWEHREELQQIRDEYYARHPPASPEARCLLDQIVMCEWHLRRFDSVGDVVCVPGGPFLHLAVDDQGAHAQLGLVLASAGGVSDGRVGNLADGSKGDDVRLCSGSMRKTRR